MSTPLPTRDQIKMSEGYDEGKERRYLELRFEDIIIREYLPEVYEDLGPSGQKGAMNLLVQRSRFRLATAIKHRDGERSKKKISRDKAQKLVRKCP